MHLNRFKIYVFNIALLIFVSNIAYSQVDTTKSNGDSTNVLPNMLNTLKNDTTDTLSNAAYTTDTTFRVSKDALNSQVICTADDTMYLDFAESKHYLYDNAYVTFEDISLRAGYIVVDYDSTLIHAYGIPDSTGKISQLPIFIQAGKEYQSAEITYNYSTKKGYIKKVITREGDGFLHGETVKKIDDEVMYVKNGSFTTCSHSHPHYRITSNKLKVISGDKIVTGPTYLEIADVPTPLLVPFGFFPANSSRKSGVLIPSYGENLRRGFFLKNGGYYFAINDYVDLELRGDIYTRGGWALYGNSKYRKRYKYNGNLNISYSLIREGDETQPNFSESKTFNIRWRHTQDPKARPNSRFTANVDAGSSDYFQNNSYNANDFLTNTLNSNISYERSWAGKPFRFSANLKHSQNTRTNAVNLTVPEITFNVSRLYPFKNEKRIGKSKWYEDIGIQYTMNARNEVQTFDSLLFRRETLDDFRNGIRHNIPISTSFKVLKVFSFSPSINMTERWYFESLSPRFIDSTNSIVNDTVSGFARAGDFNISGRLTTNLYGMYAFKKGKVKAIRHAITPSISLTYRPDFSEDMWGYYSNVQSDTLGNTRRVSRFNGLLYGGPGQGKVGSIGLGINNTLEMKVVDSKDTTGTGTKKIKLLEGLSVNTSYNAAASEFKWSDLRLSARTNLFKNSIGVNYNSTFSLYDIDENGVRINEFYYDNTGKLGRLTNASLALSFNFNGAAKAAESVEEQKTSGIGVTDGDFNYYGLDYYVDFNVPWNFNINYNIIYSKPALVENIRQSINFGGDVSLTKHWKIGFSSGYDLENKDFTFTSIDFYRDLHCWELRFNWVPITTQQSYSFNISVKAPILKDLKLERNRGIGDF